MLSASVYPAVASSGPLDNSPFLGLFAEKVTSTSPAGESCATGFLYLYPGQSGNRGAPPLSPHPLFVGRLPVRAVQLS